ncbi:S24 family peptidase [uncultured Dokdonia sp.]|uniref:S24 family peptidase n=1 Tax=uncultured Dokdonia sp. TaxID=575653 RepID=UPI0026270A70|nr:S24 family peptidase [uncultured Dokdonia sp.]
MEIEVSGKVNVSKNRHQAEVSKQTGFPSAATHYMEASIDLNEELSIHKDATFYVRVKGDTWKGFSILDKDVLIIDRSLQPNFNDLALVVQDGGFKILRIPFDKAQEAFVLWGVITYIIHCVR